ncbi:MAG: protein kinase [Betaproteobacteria bacterium]|nr:protein kinase [Betaproteobacteria bacterium]
MAAVALKKLGKYEIRGTLGKGAMGIVYDGFDPVIERRVAIKTIAKESMDPREAAELLGRFKREAQAAGRLNHPGIVSIHDYGEDDGLAFIAMEFIKGNELRKYFESQQRFVLTHIVRIVCDILDALDHAHRNGVVHRDIKPANIMITDEGRVKVADFGVAWIESSTMTQVGARIGTPAYMSPEQHQGLPVTGRSDLFSAGVILYQFLTGERPFTGNGYPLIHQILLQDPIAPSEINFDIPRALDAVTMKALAKRAEDRFATAREFAEAFREAATGESVGAGVDFVLNDWALPVNGRDAMPPPGCGQGTTTASASVTGDGGSNPASVSLEVELEYWKEIKDSTEADDFETFLRLFPGSRFAPLARRRMNRLEAEARHGTEAPVHAEARAHRQREVERHLQRIDAKEPKLMLPEDEANDVTPAMDLFPSVMVQPAFATVDLPHLEAVTGPIHARRRAAKPAHTQAVPEPPHPFASGAARKPPRLPIALVLAAALVGSGLWYATRPQFAPIIGTLRMQTQTILAQLEQEWQARQAGQGEQQRKGGEAARLAEEQRKNEEALKAERNRELALARQKEEAAQAAAIQNYERAMALLNQGRSSEAVRRLRQLAKDGNGAAAKTLGDLYSSGEDVLLDMQEAAYFYAIAERNGVEIDRPAFVRR